MKYSIRMLASDSVFEIDFRAPDKTILDTGVLQSVAWKNIAAAVSSSPSTLSCRLQAVGTPFGPRYYLLRDRPDLQPPSL